jgi:hypothetical protein
MTSKRDKQIMYAGAAIVVILLIAWFGGFLTTYGYPPPSFSTGGNTPPITDQDKENYGKGIGRWYVLESVVDSLDIATARTTNTNYKVVWYTRHGSTWSYKGAGNAQYLTLEEQDGGYLWICVEIPSGQAFYVDYQKICSNDQYIKGYLYTDCDDDGAKEFVFQYDMHGHQVPNSGYPSVTFYGFTLTYEASTFALNNLANATAIGTSTTSKFYDYYLSFTTAKSATAIRKVEVKITSTDETKVKLKKLNIPGLGYVDGSLFDKQYTSTDYRYIYTISNSFDGALYLKYGTGTQNNFDMTMELEYTLTHPDDILVTLTVYKLVAQTEAGASLSDTFYAQE